MPSDLNAAKETQASVSPPADDTPRADLDTLEEVYDWLKLSMEIMEYFDGCEDGDWEDMRSVWRYYRLEDQSQTGDFGLGPGSIWQKYTAEMDKMEENHPIAWGTANVYKILEDMAGAVIDEFGASLETTTEGDELLQHFYDLHEDLGHET